MDDGLGKLGSKISEHRAGDVVVLQRESDGALETVSAGPEGEGVTYCMEQPSGDSVTIDDHGKNIIISNRDGTSIRCYSFAEVQNLTHADGALVESALAMFSQAQARPDGFHPVDPFSLIP